MSDTHKSLFPSGVGAPPKMTGAEITVWIIFSIGAVIFGIALVVFGSASPYGDGRQVPMVWMSIGGALALLTFVPAMILTGIRQLFPALWSISSGQGKATYGQ